MQTPLTIASRQTLAAQVATLDFQINKLTKLFNSLSFNKGSLMISGKNSFGKEYHELIIWDSTTPLPKMRLQEFLQAYATDLIHSRAQLLNLLESGETTFKDETRVSKCNHCCRNTLQRNFQILPGSENIAIPAGDDTWICNECETIIKEVSK